MSVFKRRKRALVGVLAVAAAAALIPASAASAATFPNACKNSVTANNSQIGVTMTANSPASVAPGGTVALTNIQQSANVPGTIFVAGYNLGLLTVGPNTIPASVVTTIEGSNTVEGTQVTNTVSTSVSTTISDPDGSPGTGDETGTDGSFSVTYNDQTWTAGASGTINFREDTLPISAGGGLLHTGGLKITAVIQGFLQVRFGCSPGTVTGPDPGVVALDDPAVSFASTSIVVPNDPPTADAGPDQTVASGANVTLNGNGSSDPNAGDTLDYSWTQTGRSALCPLTGANTATPSFTAPTGPATLTFELTVTDDAGATDTDTVVVNVEAPPNQPPTADAGPDQTVASGASVTLNGNGSTDTDGTIASYAWTQTVGPNVSLTGANTATPSFTAPPGPATLEFRLTVTDNDGATDSDTVVVNVNAPAGSVTFPNACKNSVTPNNSQISVTMLANAPASANPGDSVALTNIQQTVSVPGAIFVAGYNLGLLAPGPNTVPASIRTTIEGTNTVEGTQTTNTVATSISTSITDPDGSRGTGDESATPGALSVSYNNQTWTADADGGTIQFREDTIQPVSGGTGGVGAIVINSVISGALPVNFGCSPGTVTGPDPGVITFDDPAVSFASTDVAAPNVAPTADAGPDQTVASGATVNLTGNGSTDTDGTIASYAWTQTGGRRCDAHRGEHRDPELHGADRTGDPDVRAHGHRQRRRDRHRHGGGHRRAAAERAAGGRRRHRPDGGVERPRQPRRERLDRSRRDGRLVRLDPDRWDRRDPQRSQHGDAELHGADRTGDADVPAHGHRQRRRDRHRHGGGHRRAAAARGRCRRAP